MRLGADEEHIRQDMPGTDDNPSTLDVTPELLFALRTHLEIILQYDRLSIQHKVLEINIIVQDVKQTIDKMDQPQPKLLKGLIPFPVPMRV